MIEFPRHALAFFARIPLGQPFPVAGADPDPHRALRLARQLETQGLVEVAQRRPKTVLVAANAFAQALHGILRARPHLAEVLHGNHVPVLAALAESALGEDIRSLAETTGRHPNTVRTLIRNLKARALLQVTPRGYRLAPHAPELAELGHLYSEHFLARALRKHPGVFPVARDGSRVLVEGQHPAPGLPATGLYRLQLDGAPVLESRFQYAISPSGRPPTPAQAYEDARRLAASPRTLRAAQEYLRKRGVTLA